MKLMMSLKVLNSLKSKSERFLDYNKRHTYVTLETKDKNILFIDSSRFKCPLKGLIG